VVNVVLKRSVLSSFLKTVGLAAAHNYLTISLTSTSVDKM